MKYKKKCIEKIQFNESSLTSLETMGAFKACSEACSRSPGSSEGSTISTSSSGSPEEDFGPGALNKGITSRLPGSTGPVDLLTRESVAKKSGANSPTRMASNMFPKHWTGLACFSREQQSTDFMPGDT